MGGTRDLTSIIKLLTSLVGAVIPIATAIALLIFLWGLITLIRNSSDAGKRKESISRMIWGIFALFIIVTLGGVVQLLSSTLLGGH